MVPDRTARFHDTTPAFDPDFLFVFLLFSATLFTLQLSGLVILYALLVAGFVAARPQRAIPLLWRCSPILALPAYALLSTLWSIAPGATLYFGSEFFLTVVAALLVGAATTPHTALKGIFAAFLLWAVANFLLGLSTGDLRASSSFIGLAGSKNAAGEAAAVGVVVGVAMLFHAVAQRRMLVIAAALLLILLDARILVAAHSTGAILAAALGTLVILLWTLSRGLPIAGRSTILLVALGIGALAVITLPVWSHAIFDDLLSMSGKDTTLTGRTYIWSRADVLISQRPWFGLGYSAFWNPGSLEAEAIWRKIGVLSRRGFNFHNSSYDLVVHLGYVGLALFAIVFLSYCAVLLLKTMRHPGISGIFFCAIVLAYASRAPFESFGTNIFHQSTLLLFAALGWATRAQARTRSPDAARSWRGTDADYRQPDRSRQRDGLDASGPAGLPTG
ncbi:MAG: O-antigen polymerase [Sphingomonas bacterium]|nr:O-antigen polymerase [Sphingomonas bacterium]